MLTKFRSLALVLTMSVVLITSFSSVIQPVNADLTGKIAVDVILQNVNAATGPLNMNVTLLSDHTLVPVVWQIIFVNSSTNGQVVKFTNLQTSTPVGQFFVCASEPLNGFKNTCTLFPLTKHNERVNFSVP